MSRFIRSFKSPEIISLQPKTSRHERYKVDAASIRLLTRDMASSNEHGVAQLMSTIPYTPTLDSWKSVNPRPLPPFYPHPDLDKIETPLLPCPPRYPVFHTNTNGAYLLSTHLVPAAFPRMVPDIPLPQVPAWSPNVSSAARLEKVEVIAKEVIERQARFIEGKLGGGKSEKLLWNCVNRYVRVPHVRELRPSSGVTLFLAHANGLHKETWETILRSLLDSPAASMIDEVWSWDAVQHGDAALVNAENLSGIFDWLDNSRDIANFLINYLPEHVESHTIPTRLERLTESVSKVRSQHGYHTRKLVVIGHSFGGCTSLRVALDFPKLISSAVMVDPVIIKPYTYRPGYTAQMALDAFMRRSHWSSREEALQLLKKSAFFSAWHPDVLKLYVDYGIVDDPSGGVKLKMSGIQEGLGFANHIPGWEMWELLEKVDEAIPLRWVVPSDKHLTTKEGTMERVWRRPANSSNIVFHFSGHLIVQEAPRELAQEVSDFLLLNYGSTKPRL